MAKLVKTISTFMHYYLVEKNDLTKDQIKDIINTSDIVYYQQHIGEEIVEIEEVQLNEGSFHQYATKRGFC